MTDFVQSHLYRIVWVTAATVGTVVWQIVSMVT